MKKLYTLICVIFFGAQLFAQQPGNEELTRIVQETVDAMMEDATTVQETAETVSEEAATVHETAETPEPPVGTEDEATGAVEETAVEGTAVEETANEETANEETAVDNTISKYRRSSLFTVLIQHPEHAYGDEITEAFLSMPVPDKFDDHSLPEQYKTFTSTTNSKKKKKDDDSNFEDIENYIYDNNVPNQLVGKWFNRSPVTGRFDMGLISERGNYDASLSDVALADMGARGRAALADAGEELIGKTFVIVNDITYINKEERTGKAGGILRIAAVVGSFVDPNIGKIANTAANVTEQFGGFSVKINSYLYRLDWNPEVAATFYQDYWLDDNNYDDGSRVAAFDESDIFKLSYIGCHSSNAGNVAVKGFTQTTDEAMISKVCTRALDRAIVELQRQHDEFKVNTPIHSIDGNGDIFVQIGLKEGLNEKSQYEVLEQYENEEGRTEYKKIAVIAPVKGRIWDNRFMAAEEAAEMAAQGVKNTDEEAKEGDVNLTATQFKKVSGGKLYPGLLVREMTIKAQKK